MKTWLQGAALFFVMITVAPALAEDLGCSSTNHHRRPVAPNPIPVYAQLADFAFECRNNELFCIERATFAAQFAQIRVELPMSRSNEWETIAKRMIQEKGIGDENYTVNLESCFTSRLKLEPRPNRHGETPAELDKADSKFRKIIGLIDRRKYPLIIIGVRADSEKAYFYARTIAEEAGFLVAKGELGKDTMLEVPFSATGISAYLRAEKPPAAEASPDSTPQTVK
jgi:hypothetical protein